jgi:hypothetical protein
VGAYVQSRWTTAVSVWPAYVNMHEDEVNGIL